MQNQQQPVPVKEVSKEVWNPPSGMKLMTYIWHNIAPAIGNLAICIVACCLYHKLQNFFTIAGLATLLWIVANAYFEIKELWYEHGIKDRPIPDVFFYQTSKFIRVTVALGILGGMYTFMSNDKPDTISKTVPRVSQPPQNITINNYSNSFNNNDNSFNNTITDTPSGPAKRKVHHITHRVPNCKKVPS
jgi:hypothetical protein